MSKFGLGVVVGAIIVCVSLALLLIYDPMLLYEKQTIGNCEIIGIYFSPNGGCEQQVIYWIDKANSSIYIMIYSFTLDSISESLIDAHDRGVEIKIVFEKNQVSKYSEYSILLNVGIDVRNDTNPKLMHNKVMIIDELIVLTGSYNWSTSAETKNNENLIVIKSETIAELYKDKFLEIYNQTFHQGGG